jgi:hypothetical protein
MLQFEGLSLTGEPAAPLARPVVEEASISGDSSPQTTTTRRTKLAPPAPLGHDLPTNRPASRSSSSSASSHSSSVLRCNNPYANAQTSNQVFYSTAGHQVHRARGDGSSTDSSTRGLNSGRNSPRSSARRPGRNPLVDSDDDATRSAARPLSARRSSPSFEFGFRTPPEEALRSESSVGSTADFLASGAAVAMAPAVAAQGSSLWSSDSLAATSVNRTADQPPHVQPLTSLPNPKAAVSITASIPHTPAELEALIAMPPVTRTVACPAGWTFSVYDSEMSQHYAIESQDVWLTQGAVKYVDFFQKYGSQTRFRFQLCKRFLSGSCLNGTGCQYIHSGVLSNSTHVHVNENSATSAATGFLTPDMIAGGINKLGYRTIPPGVVFPVFPPNSASATPQMIPSEKILVTTGAQNVFNVLSSRGGDISSCTNMKPRHCAHFQFKRMCNLGSDCNFVHSLIPYIQGIVNNPPPAASSDPFQYAQQLSAQLQSPARASHGGSTPGPFAVQQHPLQHPTAGMAPMPQLVQSFTPAGPFQYAPPPQPGPTGMFGVPHHIQLQQQQQQQHFSLQPQMYQQPPQFAAAPAMAPQAQLHPMPMQQLSLQYAALPPPSQHGASGGGLVYYHPQGQQFIQMPAEGHHGAPPMVQYAQHLPHFQQQ